MLTPYQKKKDKANNLNNNSEPGIEVTYSGQLNDNMQPNGYGLIEKDGLRYSGYFSNGMHLALVSMISVTNTKEEYFGFIKNFQKYGIGQYSNKQGTVQEGFFIKDKLIGFVREKTLSGILTEGYVINGLFNG